MKKFLKILLVVIMIFGLTGCVKYNVSMSIKDNKSVTLEVIYAIDESLMSSFTESEEKEQSGINLDDYNYLKEKGYVVSEYSEKTDDGSLSGIKITKTFENIDDITKDSQKVVDMVNIFNDENSANFDDSQFFYKNGDNYKASFKFDFSEDTEEGIDYSTYESYFNLKYQVSLPKKAISNNATSVSDDGKTLTWNLSYAKVNDVEFEFNFNQESNILLYALIGIGALAVITIVIVIVSKSKNTPKNNGNNNLNVNNMNSQTVPVQPIPMPTSVRQSNEPNSQQPITQDFQPAHNFCANCGQKTVNGICPNCGK